jgi:hypothetical protein
MPADRESTSADAQVYSLARFPDENPFPVLRIAEDGTPMYANRGSGSLLDTWKTSVGQPAPEFWRRTKTEILKTGVSLDVETTIGSRLRHALEDDQLQLFYQPQIDVRSNHLVGVEALIRWIDPELGTIAPDRFIPPAEETGLIHDIGEFLLRSACPSIVSRSINPSSSGFRKARVTCKSRRR